MSFLHDCVNVPSPEQVLRDMHGDKLEIVDSVCQCPINSLSLMMFKGNYGVE